MSAADCDNPRQREGGLLSGILKHDLEMNVLPRFDPKLDTRAWDTHYDLTSDGEAKPRPANWEEQYDALLGERPLSFADMMDRFIEECRGEVGE